MECFLARSICRVPLVTQVRHKFKSYRPRPKFLERRILESIATPVYQHQIEEDLTFHCTVEKLRKLEASGTDSKLTIKENQYELFLVKEAKQILASNWLIAACQLDSLTVPNLIEISHKFLDNGIKFILCPDTALKKAIKGTKYVNLLPLIMEHTALAVSKDDKVKELIALTKKTPGVHLLGGAVGDRIMTKQGMRDYVSLPSLDVLRGQLLSTSKAGPSKTLSFLQHHQQVLVSRLGRIGKSENEELETKS